ncbi:MAG TPA: glutamyl-tRNA reductase [Actinomycetes bacterium]|jgi:glutamyl-tRNA reductase|nr:glutamyl-tRNA reductase [Actinomycetes bacterium]
MPVFVVGLNFKSAPLDQLERLAVDQERRPKALAHLLAQDHVHEAVVLSTCNRVEVYTAISRFHGGAADVRHSLAEFHHLDPQDFAHHLYAYYEERAVQHLFAVASGVDSMVVGETQVLGQVREAFQGATAERAVGPVLSTLFRQAIKVGRRARAETRIGAGLTSTLTVGMRVAEGQLGSLAGRRVLVVGAGRMGRLAGRTVRACGAGELVVANRTAANGAALARELGGRSVPLDRIEDELVAADLVVASTAAVAPTVTAGVVAAATARRRASGVPSTLVVLDLGVPRDVDPDVRALPGVVLADLDGLRAVLETEDAGRRDEIERVRELIAAESQAFMSWQREARLGPTIRALRTRAEEVRRRELNRAASRLSGLSERERAAVEAVTKGLVNKLLHEPVVRGKALAAGPDGDLYARMLRELYALDDLDA